ncbi:Putative RxLR effector [Phytophthora palmivora]|uniref:RxLR effector protein n=1 Tax=Phytophthora palmivora TaxID=4796 RepID=A0A2P4XRJ1_9STRA|nr:Putative RxLR effector [Phytophthora palmivora]
MRFCYVVLLVTTIIFANADAMMTSEKVNALKVSIIDGKNAHTKRFLRTGDDEVEERDGYKDIAVKFLRKLMRLALYNKWIFSNKVLSGSQQTMLSMPRVTRDSGATG